MLKMTPSTLVLFPFICEVTVIRGNLLQLQSMITDMTGKKAVPSYSSYGCYCGIGGKGRPKDATDRCCRAHDCCYDRLEARGCRPRTTTYSYSYARGDVRCGSNRNWCKQEICSCDQALARCLKSSKGGYQWKYTFYPNVLCLGSAPAC